MGIPKAGIPQAGIPKVRETQTGTLPKTGIPEPGIPKSGIPKTGIPKAGIPKLGIPKTDGFTAPLIQTPLNRLPLNNLCRHVHLTLVLKVHDKSIYAAIKGTRETPQQPRVCCCPGLFGRAPRYRTRGCLRYWPPKSRSWKWLIRCKNSVRARGLSTD